MIHRFSFIVGSYKSNDWQQAISDTGTAMIAFPHYYFDKVLSEIGIDYEEGKGASTNCSKIETAPSLIIIIGGQSYSIPPIQYILRVCWYLISQSRCLEHYFFLFQGLFHRVVAFL